MENVKQLGEALVEDRLRLGISQAEFANVLRVSQQSLSKWEGDLAIPRDHRLMEIKEVLGANSESGKIIDSLLAYRRRPRAPMLEAAIGQIMGGVAPMEWERAKARLADRMAQQHLQRAGKPALASLMTDEDTRLAAFAAASKDIARAADNLSRATEMLAQAISTFHALSVSKNNEIVEKPADTS
jgi:transcriptional regulator with XRE-family HTH domain